MKNGHSLLLNRERSVFVDQKKNIIRRVKSMSRKRERRNDEEFVWERADKDYGERMIKHFGKDINSKNEMEETLLHAAVRSGDIDFVMEVLSYPNINVDVKDASGRTPIELASEEDKDDVLLAFWCWAIYEQRDDVFSSLLSTKKIDMNRGIAHNEPPLYLAVIKRRDDMVEKLLSFTNADLNFIHPDGHVEEYRSPILHVAARKGSAEVMEKLLSVSGVNVNVLRGRCTQHTPLDIAVGRGHTKVVQQLLSHPSIDISKCYRNPLKVAIEKKQFDIVDLFLTMSYPRKYEIVLSKLLDVLKD